MIRFSKTEYGTDLNNKEWVSIENHRRTFFFYYDNYFTVMLNISYSECLVSFATFKKTSGKKIITNNIFDNTKLYDNDYVLNNFSMNEQKLKLNCQDIFGKVFWIIIVGCDQFSIDTFRIISSPFNIKLKKFYDKLLTNKNFTQEMVEHGFINTSNEPYLFNRIH